MFFFPCYRYFTLVQYRSNLFFFFTFGCHTLPLTQPWNTIPLCHLYKLVKSFLWVSVTCSRKCCCCFRYVQYVIRHTGFHTPNGDCEQSVSHRNPCGKLFTQGMNFEDLASYSAFLLYVFCVGKWLCSEKLLPSSAFFFKSLRWHSWTLTFRFSTLRSCKVTLCWRKSSANFEVFKSELFVCLFTHGHNFPCFFSPPKNQKQNTKTSFFCGLVVAIRVSSWSPFGLWWPLCACWCLYPFPLLLSPEGQMFTFNTADKELPIFTVSASRERPEQRDDYHLAF